MLKAFEYFLQTTEKELTMKTYEENQQMAFTFATEINGSSREFNYNVNYKGSVSLPIQWRDLMNISQSILSEANGRICIVVEADQVGTELTGLDLANNNLLGKFSKPLQNYIDNGTIEQGRLILPYTSEFTRDYNGDIYISVHKITDEVKHAIHSGKLYVEDDLELHNICLGKVNEDGTITISEELLAIVGERTEANKSYHLRAFKMRNGVMKYIDFIRWFVGYFGADVENLSQNRIKQVQQCVNTKPHHVYLANNKLSELAYFTYERSNSRSCMRTELFSDSYPCNYIITTDDGESKRVHPFDCYELSGLGMLFVSEVPPEELDGKTLDKFPFIARSVCNPDGSYHSSVYGLEIGSYILEKVSERTYDFCDISETMIAIRNDDGDYILPYLDGDDHTVCRDYNLSFDEVLKRFNVDERYKGLEFTEFSIGQNSYYSSEDIFDTNAEGIAEVRYCEHYCAVYGEYYDEDEMTYIEDRDEWVHNDFITCGEIDIWDVIRYFRN